MSMATGVSSDQDARSTLYPIGKNVSFKDAPTNEELLEIILALTSEISVLRDRIDTHERLSGLKILPDTDAVEAYLPTDQDRNERSKNRQKLLSKIFRVFRYSFAKTADDFEEKTILKRQNKGV